MSQLTDILRKYADDLDAGKLTKNAVRAVVIVANAEGQCNATYIGDQLPHRDAGIFLCVNGIERFLSIPVAPPAFGLTRGSTH